MIDEEIANEIDNASEGSDIHGLLKKIAFQYYVDDKSASPEINWYRAQSTLYNWAELGIAKNLGTNSNLERETKKILEKYAYSHYQDRYKRKIDEKSDDDWNNALDKLADKVLFQNFLYNSGDIHGFD